MARPLTAALLLLLADQAAVNGALLAGCGCRSFATSPPSRSAMSVTVTMMAGVTEKSSLAEVCRPLAAKAPTASQRGQHAMNKCTLPFDSRAFADP